MNWAFNRVGQWHGTNELWNALVFRPAGQGTWSAYVSLASLSGNRHEYHRFVDTSAARAWCEAEMQRLSKAGQ